MYPQGDNEELDTHGFMNIALKNTMPYARMNNKFRTTWF